MNILLVCAAGMSTSLLVNRMNDAAQEKGIEVHIEAHPVGSVTSYADQSDVKIQGMYPDKPVEVINMQDYGMMNGQKVLDHAIELLNK